jgi:hypothetical protein
MSYPQVIHRVLVDSNSQQNWEFRYKNRDFGDRVVQVSVQTKVFNFNYLSLICTNVPILERIKYIEKKLEKWPKNDFVSGAKVNQIGTLVQNDIDISAQTAVPSP